MANKFAKGDVVVLKSSGIAMTVDKVPGDDDYGGKLREDYETVWFKGASREHGRFGEHLLKEFVAPSKPSKTP